MQQLSRLPKNHPKPTTTEQLTAEVLKEDNLQKEKSDRRDKKSKKETRSSSIKGSSIDASTKSTKTSPTSSSTSSPISSPTSSPTSSSTLSRKKHLNSKPHSKASLLSPASADSSLREMGGCVTKNSSQVTSAAGLPTTTTSKSMHSNRDSPSTTQTESGCSTDPDFGSLKNRERRRLSLSQSEPVKADTDQNEFRGHLHINNGQANGNLTQQTQGNGLLSEGQLKQLLAQVKAPDEDDDDDEDDDVSLPSSDEEKSRRTVEENKLSATQLVQPQKECRRLSVSGMPSSMRQDNFENKRQEVKSDTGFFDAHTLLGLGIGYACRKGLKPESPNQDDFFIVRIDDWGLYGVFDGHGPYGHDVSNFVQRELPKLIYNNPHFLNNPQEALRSSFITVHHMLETAAATHNLFDCSLSGSTATVVLHRKTTNKLIIGHVGDSRCVLGRLSKNGRKIEAVDLTNDHKPNSELEKKRILASGGQVRRLDGDIPYRVFLRGRLYPGLAMSRAIGDSVGTQAGVICEPDVSEHTITERDLFISICSDGVWEFLTSAEVVNVIHKNGIDGVQAAADSVARESWNRWIQEEGNVVDDITAEIIYLNQPPVEQTGKANKTEK